MELFYVISKKTVKGKPVDGLEDGRAFGSSHFTKKRRNELRDGRTAITLAEKYLNPRFFKSPDPALFLDNGQDSFTVIEEKINVAETDAFAFFEKRDVFNSLADFAFACARKKLHFTIDYYNLNDRNCILYNPVFSDPVNIEKRIGSLTPKAMETDCFMRKLEYINEYTDDLFLSLPQKDIVEAIVPEDEWNSVFICAELPNIFAGYWWQTTA